MSASEFQIDKKLESARLTKTVELTDSFSGNSFDVSVDLTWTATSQPEVTRNRFYIRTAGSITQEQNKGTLREASAAGTVSRSRVHPQIACASSTPCATARCSRAKSCGVEILNCLCGMNEQKARKSRYKSLTVDFSCAPRDGAGEFWRISVRFQIGTSPTALKVKDCARRFSI